MKYNEADLKAILSDSRYSDMGNLPSNFFPYPGETKIFARPFEIPELRLLSRAATLGDNNHMLRAIDLVITLDAGSLTIGDMFYVMMWLRIQSMPKRPYVISWDCGEVVIVNKESGQWLMNDDKFKMPEDEENYEARPCDTANSEIIHQTQIEIISLPDDFGGLPKDSAIEYDFPRARLYQNIQESLLDPGLKLLTAAAQWVKIGETIEEKLAVLETQGNLDCFDEAEKLNQSVIHGIGESTMLECRKCRKRLPHQLKLDALSFFL